MRLQERYNKEIQSKLKEKFGYDNIFQIPKMVKVVINVGFGRHGREKAYMETVQKSLIRIAGQKPIMTKAKKSISAFKLREGQVIGACVTLRGQRMYDFVDKIINTSFPRVRDFRGISTSIIDNRGNLTVGFKEHVAFPEISVDEIDNVHGLEISISTTATSKEEGLELFKLMGFPFKKDE
jgi:large subunit ribosomal protein L5